jgi:hypothetical protein
MLKETIAAMLVVTGVVVASAQERDVIARFDGGIGVIPVTGGAGMPNGDGTLPNVKLNVVRGVSPAGPWRIADLKAVVDADGGISVKGKGLLLASGNSIGQNANASVFATLICETAAPFVLHNTGSVALDPDGDFTITDTLDPVPSDCASPVLLIRANGSGVWFAAGIPKLAGQ